MQKMQTICEIENEDKHANVFQSGPKDIRSLAMNRLRVIPCMGLLMALLSGFFFATAQFTVDLMDHVDSSFVVMTRSLIQLAFFLPPAIYFREPLTGIAGERVALWERCFFGLSVLTSYYALSFISLADSSAIGFSAPVFVSVFACFLLHEPCGLFQVSTVLGTLVGVVLIARPSFIFPEDSVLDVFSTDDRVIGIILSVVTCLTMAYTYVSMRKLQKTPTNVVVAVFSIFCIIVCSLVMNVVSFFSGVSVVIPHSTFDWTMIGVNGICGVLGQLTLVVALKLEEAGLVAVMRTFDIVIAFLYQAMFLNQPIQWTSILGAVIVCSGCIVVSLKKYFDSKRTKNIQQ